MESRNRRLRIIIISAFLFTLSGCNNSTNYIQERTSEADYTTEAERKSSLNQFEEKVSELKNLTARLKTESRDLMGKSSEGGEITRYTDDKGSVLRYNIKLYGEMGRSESDYFFDDEVIYYTGLQEEYTSPIYEPNSNVKSDVMERYMIKGGSCYQYDSGNDEYLLSDGVDMPYLSLQELEEEFSAAEEKREGGETYSRYGILAVNGYILGGYYDNQWIEVLDLYPNIAETEQYKIYIDGQYKTVLPGQKMPIDSDEDAEPSLKFTEELSDFHSVNYIAAYSGSRDLKIESGTAVSPDNEIYQKTLQEYLKRNGLTGDFNLNSITKIDIDSDGQDEILIQAYQFEDDIHEAVGIQYMRKMSGGKVKEYTLPLTTPVTDDDHLMIYGFCDLNGDGVKEVLLSVTGIGYYGCLVYEFGNDGFTRIYENGHVH